MSLLADTLVMPFRIVKIYTEALVKDVQPGDFARKARGVDANSPAFNFGHLTLYPERILTIIGRPDLARPDDQWDQWFKAGQPCVDDPDCRVYPAMSVIMDRFHSRYGAAIEAVKSCDDAVFSRPNPNERMKDMLPTVGGVVAFLLDGHCQSHLGQVSFWRRCMGMKSAF